MRALAWLLCLTAVLAGSAGPVGAQDAGKKFGDAAFIGYEGPQAWPTGSGAQVISDFAVPIYIGLPGRKYRILGRVYDERTTGLGVMTRAFAEGLFSERDRQRDCADQAKFRGGDALMITNDEAIIKAFGLSKEDLAKTTPLFKHKDSVTAVIKFE
jgi:hypothetical protein